jgi:uncharacterized protein
MLIRQIPNQIPSQRPPWRNVMLLLGLIVFGMGAGNVLGFIVFWLGNGFGLDVAIQQLPELIQNPSTIPNGWWYLMILQLLSHSFTFLLPALAYWRMSEGYHLRNFITRPLPPSFVILLAIVIVLVLMPFNSWMIELNGQMTLPKVFQSLENWMKEQEDSLANLTTFMTNFDSIPQLMFAIVVIAAVPALGEEVLFRGIIQRKILTKTHSHHAAIWLSAILFSAIHFQFYGFLPRMLLGAMFGYLYWWSANLWIPIIAHFINNAFTVCIFFLNHHGIINFDIEQSQNSVPLMAALLSLVSTIFLLIYLKRIAEKTRTIYHDTRQ